MRRERVEWSCGCTTDEPAGFYKVGHWGRCNTHSVVVGYDYNDGDPVLERDVQVVGVHGGDRKESAVNVNDFVWVRLTEAGWATHDQFYAALNLDPAPYRASLGQTEGGWQRFQLWALMEMFGPGTHMGMAGPPFEGNVLHLADPADDGGSTPMNDPSIGGYLTDPKACPHVWQPVSFRFETQLLDEHGRVSVRQPDLERGRVYLVCLGCAQHTYVETNWVGYRLVGSDDRGFEYRPNSSHPYRLPGQDPQRECPTEAEIAWAQQITEAEEVTDG